MRNNISYFYDGTIIVDETRSEQKFTDSLNQLRTIIPPLTGYFGSEAEGTVAFYQAIGSREQQQDGLSLGFLKIDLPDDEKAIHAWVNQEIEQIQEQLNSLDKPLRQEAGSTYLRMMIHKGKVYVFNMGDCEARLIYQQRDNFEIERLNLLDKPSQEHERKRIENTSQGSISDGRLRGDLDVSAGFCDERYDDLIRRTVLCRSHNAGDKKPDSLLLNSDGLFQNSRDDEKKTADTIKKNLSDSPLLLAERLVKSTMNKSKWFADNTTAVAINYPALKNLLERPELKDLSFEVVITDGHGENAQQIVRKIIDWHKARYVKVDCHPTPTALSDWQAALNTRLKAVLEELSASPSSDDRDEAIAIYQWMISHPHQIINGLKLTTRARKEAGKEPIIVQLSDDKVLSFSPPLMIKTSDTDVGNFMDAVKDGNPAKVKALLKNNAYLIQCVDKDQKKTALHWAAHGGHAHTLRILLAASSQANHSNDSMIAAMKTAAENGHLEAVKILLSELIKKQVDIDFRSIEIKPQYKDNQIIEELLKFYHFGGMKTPNVCFGLEVYFSCASSEQFSSYHKNNKRRSSYFILEWLLSIDDQRERDIQGAQNWDRNRQISYHKVDWLLQPNVSISEIAIDEQLTKAVEKTNVEMVMRILACCFTRKRTVTVTSQNQNIKELLNCYRGLELKQFTNRAIIESINGAADQGNLLQVQFLMQCAVSADCLNTCFLGLVLRTAVKANYVKIQIVEFILNSVSLFDQADRTDLRVDIACVLEDYKSNKHKKEDIIKLLTIASEPDSQSKPYNPSALFYKLSDSKSMSDKKEERPSSLSIT